MQSISRRCARALQRPFLPGTARDVGRAAVRARARRRSAADCCCSRLCWGERPPHHRHPHRRCCRPLARCSCFFRPMLLLIMVILKVSTTLVQPLLRHGIPTHVLGQSASMAPSILPTALHTSPITPTFRPVAISPISII